MPLKIKVLPLVERKCWLNLVVLALLVFSASGCKTHPPAFFPAFQPPNSFTENTFYNQIPNQEAKQSEKTVAVSAPKVKPVPAVAFKTFIPLKLPKSNAKAIGLVASNALKIPLVPFQNPKAFIKKPVDRRAKLAADPSPEAFTQVLVFLLMLLLALLFVVIAVGASWLLGYFIALGFLVLSFWYPSIIENERYLFAWDFIKPALVVAAIIAGLFVGAHFLAMLPSVYAITLLAAAILGLFIFAIIRYYLKKAKSQEKLKR